MMRIAVFSDVHGNIHACRAVLQAINQEENLDAIVAAGDLCLGGSDPGGCIDLLRQGGVMAVYGNTEVYIRQPERAPADDLHRQMWEPIRQAAYWVRQRLSASQMAWLDALSFEQRISPTGQAGDDVLVVHANPKDVELMIYPSEEEQERLFGEVRQPDDDFELRRAMEGVDAGVIVFGHYHRVFERRWRDKLLVDVASCSLNGIDKDYRARYTIFHWQEGRWKLTRRWVSYPVELEVAALAGSDMPSRDLFLRYFA